MHDYLLSRRTAVLAAVAAATVLTVTFAAATLTVAQVGDPARTPALPTAKCNVPADQARLETPLSRFAFRLASGLPIKVVAIGSSSTYGAGASSAAASYPSRLEVELERHFAGHDITVVNRGVNGEEASDMIARFETAVIAEKPDLVLWQVGTNSLLRDRPLDSRATVLHEGLAQLKPTRADVILIDPQYVPRVIAKGQAVDDTVAILETVARQEKVGHFRRFAMMRRWHEVDGLPFETFVSPDGLHMNDWSYACFAKWLGVAITEAATRPTETASAPRPATAK
jgi:lysophospholipase L1-like esterase